MEKNIIYGMTTNWPLYFTQEDGWDGLIESTKYDCLLELIRLMPFDEALKRFGIEKYEYIENDTCYMELSMPKQP